MEITISQNLFQEAPFAFAHHHIVRDDQGAPIDVDILDFNDAFQAMIFPNQEESHIEMASQVKHPFYNRLLSELGAIDQHLRQAKSYEFTSQFEQDSIGFVQVYTPDDDQIVVLINETLNASKNDTLDHLPVMICKYDQSGRILYANHQFANLLNLPPSAVIGKTFRDLLPEEEKKGVGVILERLNGGEEVITELRKLEYGPKPIWQEWTTSTLKNKKGEILAYQAVGTDVTEQKEAEIAVIESEARLKAIIDSTPDIICYKDKEGRWLMANDMMIEVFDMEDIDFYGKTDAELADISSPVYKQAFSTCSQSDKMTKSNQKLTRNEELIPYLKEGVLRMYDIVKVPVKEKDGTDKGIVVIGYDITERKAAEDALRASEANFRLLFENSPIGIFAAHPNGTLIDANQSLLEHLEVDQVDQARAINVLTYAPMIKSGFSEAFLRCIRENKMQKGSDFILSKGDKNRSVYVYIFPLTDESNEISRIYGLVEDITDRKRAEGALKKARNKAIRASKVKSEFLANMSHEIRTPLNGLIGFTNLLKNTSLTDTQDQYVKNASTSAHALLDIINDILDFSKIEADKLELDIIKTDINQTLEEARDIVKFQANHKGLDLLLNIDKDLPKWVDIDPTRIKQILVNLLSNAIKFTQKGEVELKLGFQALNEQEGLLQFSVRDTGIGIPEDKQEELFQAFSQADSSTSRRFGGTGLGLTISQRLAEKMESKIAYTSEDEVGTTFYFQIKTNYYQEASSSNGQVATAPIKAPINQERSPSSLKILVAEDNNINMLLVSTMLGKIYPGATIIKCANGIEALQLFKEVQPDIVLMDVQMPEMNGIEATEAIREWEAQTAQERTVPIIALTAGALKVEKERAMLAGMNGFLTKPFEEAGLSYTLRQHLATVDEN